MSGDHFKFFNIFRRSRKQAAPAKTGPTPEEIQSKASTQSSEASAYRFDGGRRYHNHDDVAYILPNDEEENDRVHQQHWMLKASFGANFDSPVEDALEKGIEVLDSGCGPATWTLEMAEQYPNSKFHGTDISLRFPEVVKPANCQFHLHNIVEGAPFPDNTFGFIHQRLLVLGLLAKDWSKALDGMMRVLKPGGWIELVEVSFPKYSNAGPKCSLLMDSVVTFGKDKGLDPGVSHVLKKLLEEAGTINIVEREITIPLSHSGKIGELLWEDFRDIFTALHPMVAKIHPELTDEDAYRSFLAACKEECKENGTDLYFMRCYGQKPLSTQDA